MSMPEIIPKGADASVKWWEETRRPELLRLFSEHVYGKTPDELPEVKHTLKPRSCEFPGVEAAVLTTVMERNGKTCAFESDVYRPSESEGPLPAVIMINPFSVRGRDWPKSQVYGHCPPDILARAGFIAVHAHVDQACADDKDTYHRGLMELYPPSGENGWGAIGGWAFCASRLVDYLLTRSDVKPGGIAVCGCSRAGKTALWCGAQDTRINVTISNVSGCSGAAVTRNKTGERVKDITGTFPHWFCKRYNIYAGREDDLPVDQHMLLALWAPRPVYVSSASEDIWADPYKEFESALLCGEAYRIYGKRGLGEAAFPQLNTPLIGCGVGYHVRRGEHGCEVYDWERFISFIRESCFEAENTC